jgi:proteasome lid subunit RPN8/RPN11
VTLHIHPESQTPPSQSDAAITEITGSILRSRSLPDGDYQVVCQPHQPLSFAQIRVLGSELCTGTIV